MSNIEIVDRDVRNPVRLRCKVCPVQRCLDVGQALEKADVQQFEQEHRHGALPPEKPKPRYKITLEPPRRARG